MDIEGLLRVWMDKWDPELSEVLQGSFLENSYAKLIVRGTEEEEIWSDSDVYETVQEYVQLKKILGHLLRRDQFLPPEPPDGNPPQGSGGTSGSRKPRKPRPSSGSGSAAKRPKRKKQFENNDEFFSASFGQRPRGRSTPMSGETCNSCGSPIRWDGNCNCS